MIPLFGDDTRKRREINLGGISSASTHSAILDQAKARRTERLATRRREESAIKLQRWWKAKVESRKVKALLCSWYDADPQSIDGLRCLTLIGLDKERLGKWSTSVISSGLLYRFARGPTAHSWLVLIKQLSVLLVRIVARSPESSYSLPHLQVLKFLLSPSSAMPTLGTDALHVCQEIATNLLHKGVYESLSEATLRIPSNSKQSPVLPLLVPLYTNFFSIFTIDTPTYIQCLQMTLQHIITVPLLLNRLPLTCITQLSAELPLLSLHLLSSCITDISSSISLQSKAHLMANLSTLITPRLEKLTTSSLDVYLRLITSLIIGMPVNAFEPSNIQDPTALNSWSHLAEEEDVDDFHAVSGVNAALQHARRQLDLDNRTRTRLQSLASDTHIRTLLSTSTRHPSTRNTLFNFLVTLYTLWPAKKDKILSAIVAATGSGLIRELFRGDVRSSPLGKDEDTNFITDDPKLLSHWTPMIFLVDLYTQSLLTMGDDEFFSSTTGTTGPRNSLTLDELTIFSRQLMNIALSLYMRNDQMYTQEGPISKLPIGWENLREKITKCLQAIHARDSRRPFTPPDHWLLPARHNMESFVDAAVFEERQLDRSVAVTKRQLSYLSPRLGILNNIPFAVPFEVRVAIFQQFIVNDMEKFGGRNPWDRVRTQAVVRRDNLAADGFDKLENAFLKGRVEITFIDQFGQEESGIDGGGLFKEFFTSLCKEVFDTNRGLWLETNKRELYPNPHSYAKEPHSLRWYRFIGRILGKALYDGILVDVAFAGFFLAKWLGKQSFLDDLVSLDPELYQGLIFLKHYPGDPEELSLTFSVNEDDLGVTRTIDLIPNGSNVPVTRENRLQYIYLVSHYRLTKQIRPQSEAFFDGLSEMIDPKWLRMFNQQELQILIGGVDSPIDLDDLRSNTLYGGLYSDDEPTIEAFWRVVKSLNQDQRRALLRFATSCSRPPLLGFKELSPKFCIRDAGTDQARLPTASTCVNLLKLPKYNDERVLRDKLIQAIHSGAGFDLS